MTAVTSLIATAIVVVLPAWGMRRWAERRGDDAVQVTVATAMGPVAALPLLWIAATQLGIRPMSTALAGVVATALLWVAGAAPTSRPAAPRPGAVRTLIVVSATLLALCAVAFAPYGLERADGIHRMAMTDWQKHLMLAGEMTLHDEFPPMNPFLRSSGPSPYYHGFPLMAANLARATGGASALYGSLLALTLLTAALLPLTAYVVARGLFDWSGVARLAAMGAALLAGFDMLVVVLHAAVNALTVWGGDWTLAGIRELVPSTHPDYWLHHNERQFNAPYLAVVWAPQHVLAACAGVLGFHWLSRDPGISDNRLDALPAAMLLAATPMLSAYVGLALASGLVIAFAMVSGERWRWLGAGAVAAALALPFMRLAATAPSGLELAPSAAGTWRNGALFTSLLGDGNVARILDTPAVYLFDLGILGVLAVLSLRALNSVPPTPHRSRGLVLAGTVLLLVAMLRPPLGAPNNLYARGLLLAWILLAPFAATEWQRRRSLAWGLAATLCLAGTVYGAAGAFLEGYLFWATPTAAVRTARAVNERSAAHDVVAMPLARLPGSAYWLRRSTVMYDGRHALLFGAAESQVAAIEAAQRQAVGEASPTTAARRLEELGATIVILPAGSVPPAWRGSECFSELYRNTEWVALRLQGECHDD